MREIFIILVFLSLDVLSNPRNDVYFEDLIHKVFHLADKEDLR